MGSGAREAATVTNGDRAVPPQGFDLSATTARGAIRAISAPPPPSQGPGRVANVFRRRGQWSLLWWEIETLTPAPEKARKPT